MAAMRFLARLGAILKGAAALGLIVGLGACAAVENTPLAISFDAADSSLGEGDGAIIAASENAPEATPIAVEDRTRKAVISHIPFNVSIWMRRDADRQFMVQREDLQPMFLAEWSQGRAESAIIAAYGKGECREDMALLLEKAIWDPTGVWVIDGGCRDIATVLASLRPFPKLRPAR